MTLLIRGTVLGATGAPVAGAAVLIAAAPVPVPDVALLSSADGGFTLSVPAAGRYRLGARSDRHGQTEVALEVGAAGAHVTLHLPG